MARPGWMTLVSLALGLGCAPRPTEHAPTRSVKPSPAELSAESEATIESWREVIVRSAKAAVADHRARHQGEPWLWTEAERAELDACKAEARVQIQSASAAQRPYLVLAYALIFEITKLDTADTDALLEVPPGHPAWATFPEAAFVALRARPEQAHAHARAIAAEHDAPIIQAGLAYYELERADRAHDWDRARELYAKLQSPALRATHFAREAQLYDPERPLRAGSLVPHLCLRALEGLAGDPPTACLDQLIAPERRTLIVGWASWCGPCNEQLPTVIELAEAHALRVVSITYDEDPEAARTHLVEHGVDWIVLQIDDAEIREARDFGGDLDHQPIPYLALVDGEGRVEAGLPWLETEALRELLVAR